MYRFIKISPELCCSLSSSTYTSDEIILNDRLIFSLCITKTVAASFRPPYLCVKRQVERDKLDKHLGHWLWAEQTPKKIFLDF